ncbi:hypothetical protein [Roseivirga pacifica]|uniref:hypothetical protein n=1 Tax=Roseivirga pacifica TaxID=1267423 RepID=UPI00209450E4|nr:hypothetical protein [Roseivirga pacifica]MCO6359717.1 hypothetical protein [Roseivirga pacifica]MCO6367087.1 hypothetical protein [Roseivirga pacifica]MCO6370381.1 hypothetical protein [Roseivirga pacifica]MCO6374744.1 hypothetical protein [Roseivirga pacifica]MCO6380002.1 hypothetical protein [Roseivirga pacifica]
MHKLTGYIAFTGLAIVLLSILSRFVDLVPIRYRTTALIVGFTLMFLGTLWRVVTEMNAKEEEE